MGVSMVCFDSIIPMEDPEIDSSDDHPYDPIKKFQVQSIISQQLINKLETQVIRKFSKIYNSPIDDNIYQLLYQNSKDVERFMILVLEEINISLKLANLQFVYEPFKRIISFMNTLTEMNLGHFHRLLKEYRHKEMVIENMKDKTNPRAPKTLGIIDNEELKRMKRMQIQEEEREKYNNINDQDFLLELESLLKHRVYEQNYRTPMTTHELLDIKEKMEEICMMTEKITLTNTKNKIEYISNDQSVMVNHKLIDELTKDIHGKFEHVFKDHYKDSIENNAAKMTEQRIIQYKESLVTTATQTPETSFKKHNKEITIRDIEHKNRIIESLTNRANLYELVIENNKSSNLRLLEDIQKHKSLCSSLAQKYQELEQDFNQVNTFNALKMADIDQEIKTRDVTIKRLNDLIEGRGPKTQKVCVSTETEIMMVDKEVETVEDMQEQRGMMRILESHIKTKSKKISVSGETSDNLKKTVLKRRSTIIQHMTSFLQQLSVDEPKILYQLIERIEYLDYQKMKVGIERMIKGEEPFKTRIHCSIQTDQEKETKVESLKVIEQRQGEETKKEDTMPKISENQFKSNNSFEISSQEESTGKIDGGKNSPKKRRSQVAGRQSKQWSSKFKKSVFEIPAKHSVRKSRVSKEIKILGNMQLPQKQPNIFQVYKQPEFEVSRRSLKSSNSRDTMTPMKRPLDSKEGRRSGECKPKRKLKICPSSQIIITPSNSGGVDVCSPRESLDSNLQFSQIEQVPSIKQIDNVRQEKTHLPLKFDPSPILNEAYSTKKDGSQKLPTDEILTHRSRLSKQTQRITHSQEYGCQVNTTSVEAGLQLPFDKPSRSSAIKYAKAKHSCLKSIFTEKPTIPTPASQQLQPQLEPAPKRLLTEPIHPKLQGLEVKKLPLNIRLSFQDEQIYKPKRDRDSRYQVFQVLNQLSGGNTQLNPKRSLVSSLFQHKRLLTTLPPEPSHQREHMLTEGNERRTKQR